ncbi:hypothetical protein E2C01_043910 [Portunus trituberculatus]|uniref:Uncharacterized protein n=1 Tax=Portunus trituberculatus TaxID=210409 RepID=A0A5B7FYZ1_PORTR|nr:hypothetical protein [Portunus trituberculatus]
MVNDADDDYSDINEIGRISKNSSSNSSNYILFLRVFGSKSHVPAAVEVGGSRIHHEEAVVVAVCGGRPADGHAGAITLPATNLSTVGGPRAKRNTGVAIHRFINAT